MSKFVGKTLESINSVLNNSGLFTQEKTSSKFISWYLDSESFARKLKHADSKKNEESIINTYLNAIQKRLSEVDVSSAEIEEMIKLCLTCAALGYATPFIHIHCLKLAQKGNLKEKHTGYLASTYFLSPDHELAILLINTLQKDLCSTNYMEVQCALSCICSLIGEETVSNVLPLVQEKINHEKSSIRKLAILALCHCLCVTNSQSAFEIAFPKLEKALSDRDLDVVSATVSAVNKIVFKIPGDFSYLIRSLIELQEQILLRRIPNNMMHCDSPAPWLQIDILKLLKHLYKKPEHTQQMTPILLKTMKQVRLQSTLSYAILYQAIDTITCIEPGDELVDTVFGAFSAFMKQKSLNVTLIGIQAITLVIERLKINHLANQQDKIMESLKCSDETLQLKCMEVLYLLANPLNVKAVCKKMMEYLSDCTNVEKQKDTAMKILQLSTKFIDEKEFYISTTLSVLLKAGHNLASDCNPIIDTILEDSTLKELARTKCLELCRKEQHLPSPLLKLAVSVMKTTSNFEEMLPTLIVDSDEESTSFIFISLIDLVLRSKEISPNFVTYLKKLEINQSKELMQLLKIIENISNIGEYNTNEKIDPTLSFLDNFVLTNLEESDSCYLPPRLRLPDVSIKSMDLKDASWVEGSAKSFDKESHTYQSPSQLYSIFSTPSSSFQSLPCEKDFKVLTATAKSIWTEAGRQDIIETNPELLEDAQNTQVTEMDKELSQLFAGLS